MATIKAFIRTSTNDKDKLVNVRFRLTDGRKIQLFHKSEIKVKPNDFDTSKDKIKAKITYDSEKRQKFDDSIVDRKKIIETLYLGATDKTVLTSKWLDEAIDKHLHPEKYIQDNKPTAQYLIEYIDNFITRAPQRKKKRDNTFVRQSTIKSYVANRNRIKAFADHKGKADFLLSEIDADFITDYTDFLTNKKRIVKTKRGEVINETKQYTNNTIGDAMKTLKTFLADAPGHKTDLKEDIVVYKEEIDNVYLTEEELQRLRDFDFSDKPYLDRVRDGFLCLAWTCSRISDIGKIGNVKNGMIYYNQQKTNKKVVIPMHPVVKEILTKYDGKLPSISDQKFNDYIKEACRLAGINQEHTITRTVGGRLISETMPKYKLISSHTGRRSFCTNQYLRGIDTLMIRSISGHRTEKSFLSYIKVTAEQHAERMEKKWSEMYK